VAAAFDAAARGGVAPGGTVRMLGWLLLLSVFGCAAPDEPPPAEPARMHDHTPRHGGVVSMAGGVHVELVARPDGHVRVYLTDRRRRPLAPESASGSVVLSDDGLRLPLVPAEGRLEARGPGLPVGDVRMRLDLVHDGRRVDVNLVVPVGIAPGLAGLPRACGAPLGPVPRGDLLPRCTVEFPRMVRALAATADARLLLVGVGPSRRLIQGRPLLRGMRVAADRLLSLHQTAQQAARVAGQHRLRCRREQPAARSGARPPERGPCHPDG